MDSVQNSIDMLCMFTHPVFLVKDGMILGANREAANMQIKENTPVFDILLSGSEEYRSFTGGSLSLTVGLGPVSFIAAVVRTAECDFFHLNCGQENSDLNALALASQQLRDPLTNVISLSDSLFGQRIALADDKEKIRIAQLNQNLHRLLRSVGNMSDARSCSNRTLAMEHCNIPAVIAEAVQTAQQNLEKKANITFTANSSSLTGLADRELLERAVYNMLSNAVRHGEQDTIHVTLRCDKERVQFIVENRCKNISTELLGTIFFRYRRTPSITDSGSGMGLGIPMVQAIASAHKGTLLVTLPESNTIRFCLTIPVIQDKGGKLRSPVLCPDYAGGFDRSLIELSDILPSSAYEV